MFLPIFVHIYTVVKDLDVLSTAQYLDSSSSLQCFESKMGGEQKVWKANFWERRPAIFVATGNYLTCKIIVYEQQGYFLRLWGHSTHTNFSPIQASSPTERENKWSNVYSCSCNHKHTFKSKQYKIVNLHFLLWSGSMMYAITEDNLS